MSDGMTDRRGQPTAEELQAELDKAMAACGVLTAQNLQLELAAAQERVNRIAMEGQLVQQAYNAAVADVNRLQAMMEGHNDQG
jgi:hypothetical protein